LRADCHRSGTDIDSPDWHPGHERVGEPCSEYWSSNFCWWLGPRAALALLDCADYWGNRGWLSVSSPLWWTSGGESPSVCLTIEPWPGAEMGHVTTLHAYPLRLDTPDTVPYAAVARA